MNHLLLWMKYISGAQDSLGTWRGWLALDPGLPLLLLSLNTNRPPPGWRNQPRSMKALPCQDVCNQHTVLGTVSGGKPVSSHSLLNTLFFVNQTVSRYSIQPPPLKSPMWKLTWCHRTCAFWTGVFCSFQLDIGRKKSVVCQLSNWFSSGRQQPASL